MVDVTAEALHSVKEALSKFMTDIQGLSTRASNKEGDILAECKNQVVQSQRDVVQSEMIIAQLTNQASILRKEIKQSQLDIRAIAERIPRIQNNICSLETQISALDSQISALYSQLAGCDGRDIRDQIQAKINSLQSRFSQCHAAKEHHEDELRTLDIKKSELQQQLNQAKNQLSQVESDLGYEKNRCNKLKEKLERLKNSYDRVESDLSAYVSATKQFEAYSSSSAQKKVSAVDKCLSSIEEYLSTSL